MANSSLSLNWYADSFSLSRMVTPAVAVGVSIAVLFALLVASVVIGFCIYLYKHPTVEMTRVREIKKDTSKIKEKADRKRRQKQTQSTGPGARWVCCIRSRDDDVPENGDEREDPESIRTSNNGLLGYGSISFILFLGSSFDFTMLLTVLVRTFPGSRKYPNKYRE